MVKSGKNSKTLKKNRENGKVREKFESIKKTENMEKLGENSKTLKKTGKTWKSQGKTRKRLKRQGKHGKVRAIFWKIKALK